ncbi:MAG: cytochrome c oxidase subunit 3 [Candidatus Thiodiazotropha endolucinida]
MVIEATFLGRHTSLVYRGLRVGIFCFLWSEGFFFFCFFLVLYLLLVSNRAVMASLSSN